MNINSIYSTNLISVILDMCLDYTNLYQILLYVAYPMDLSRT